MTYRDMNDIIREFWECSLKSDFAEFDWDEAFDEFLPYLQRNNIGHALGTFEEFYDEHVGLYGDLSGADGLGEQFAWEYIGFDGVQALEGALRAKYDAGRQYFMNDGVHSELYELQQRVENRSDKLPGLIQLFDECIHAEHCNGNILEDVDDVDDLRKEVEEQRNAHVTNIRDFL